MPTFAYTARTLSGELKNATMEAANRDEVVANLRRQKLVVVKVDEETKKKKGGKVKTRDIVIFTRQFSTMINSGLPLVQALDILSRQSENKALQDVTHQVVYDVESGHTVADALRRHPKAFTDLYVNMVAAGEAGGILDTILMRLATFLEKNDALVGKVKSAMIYPAVIMSVAFIAIVTLLIFVIPVFENMFASVNLALPLPTRIVIMLSSFLKHYWWAVGGGAWFTVFSLKRYYKTANGQLNIDKLLLKVPVLGDMLRKSAVSRFTRTLGTLLSSGVPILDALEIVAKTAGNVIVEEAILYTRLRISEGKNMAGPLTETNIFPPMVVQMVGVGEQTGALDAMLSKIADFYEEEVDVAVAALTSLIEPAMMVGIGGTVGVVLIAMYLPIFSIAGKIKGG